MGLHSSTTEGCPGASTCLNLMWHSGIQRFLPCQLCLLLSFSLVLYPVFHPGPDLGLGKLGSCLGASITRGLHIRGPCHLYILSIYIYIYIYIYLFNRPCSEQRYNVAQWYKWYTEVYTLPAMLMGIIFVYITNCSITNIRLFILLNFV